MKFWPYGGSFWRAFCKPRINLVNRWDPVLNQAPATPITPTTSRWATQNAHIQTHIITSLLCKHSQLSHVYKRLADDTRDFVTLYFGIFVYKQSNEWFKVRQKLATTREDRRMGPHYIVCKHRNIPIIKIKFRLASWSVAVTNDCNCSTCNYVICRRNHESTAKQTNIIDDHAKINPIITIIQYYELGVDYHNIKELSPIPVGDCV